MMGNVNQVEVVVHVDKALDERQRSELIGQLREHDGVTEAHFTPGRDHLLLVDYDRDTVSAQEVLGYVREAHTGAELVGPM
jgi:hypothetical protein